VDGFRQVEHGQATDKPKSTPRGNRKPTMAVKRHSGSLHQLVRAARSARGKTAQFLRHDLA
jgi:hypothetical protein